MCPDILCGASVPTTTRSSGFIAGERICEFTTSRNSSLPFVPRSHPFIERLIGTLRREYLDQIFFWNGLDLHRKLDRFARLLQPAAVHAGLGGQTPFQRCGRPCANRRIYMTSRGNPTVLVSSTRRLLRNQDFAMDTVQPLKRHGLLRPAGLTPHSSLNSSMQWTQDPS